MYKVVWSVGALFLVVPGACAASSSDSNNLTYDIMRASAMMHDATLVPEGCALGIEGNSSTSSEMSSINSNGSFVYGAATEGTQAMALEHLFKDDPSQALCMWMQMPNQKVAAVVEADFYATFMPYVAQLIKRPSKDQEERHTFEQNKTLLRLAWLSSLGRCCEAVKIDRKEFNGSTVAFAHLVGTTVGRFIFSYQQFGHVAQWIKNDSTLADKYYVPLASRIDHVPIPCAEKYLMHCVCNNITPWDEAGGKQFSELVQALAERYLQEMDKRYAIKGLLAIDAQGWRGRLQEQAPESVDTENKKCCSIL